MQARAEEVEVKKLFAFRWRGVCACVRAWMHICLLVCMYYVMSAYIYICLYMSVTCICVYVC